uniref:Uncharacterized protein LOC114339719 n=1 Tax=Diabrotica virgifera virgifera TaxID=50390 RepID=A0A6P7GJR4_DIAVI
MDIGEQLDKQMANLRTYFKAQAESSTFHRSICAVDDSTPLKLREQEMRINHLSKDEKMRTWMGKPLHGRHLNEVNQEYVDSRASNYWLVSGKMFSETEVFLLAIQDQVIPTRNYLKRSSGPKRQIPIWMSSPRIHPTSYWGLPGVCRN